MARNDGAAKRCSDPGRATWRQGRHVEYLRLPDTDREDRLDDYLMGGHTVEDLWRLVKPIPPPEYQRATPTAATTRAAAETRTGGEPMSLEDAHTVFHRWLGEDYDIDALDAVLAAAAVEKFDDGATRSGC